MALSSTLAAPLHSQQDTVESASPTTAPQPIEKVRAYRPNSGKAPLYSAIFPGLGQIYNRKYWKLPLVYGSFLGCAYAITWNNTQFTGYRQAYRDFLAFTNGSDALSWRNYIIPSSRFPLVKNWTEMQEQWQASDITWFQNTLKQRKDYYNHYRDMSIFITIGVYGLWILDSYIDSQLSGFDISYDLSLKLRPAILLPDISSSSSLGLQLSMTF
ncbi:MAG: DUF5683 domain-containing protein [Dysgonamonadaceae bacterium]|nr:DUF5683 domain-containing protein [Dysgonamonadaceae bacterium]